MQRFKKILSTAVTVTTISWSIGLGTLIPLLPARASITTFTAANILVGATASIKASSAVTAILGTDIIRGTPENLSSLTVTVTASNGFVASDLLGMNADSSLSGLGLYRDHQTLGTRGTLDVNDTAIALNPAPTLSLSGTTTLTVATPAENPIPTGNDGGMADFFVVVRTSSTAANLHSFTVGMANTGNAGSFSGAGGQNLTSASVTSPTITIDTVAPTLTSSAPTNNATGVPIDGSAMFRFNENLDQSTLTPANITFTANGNGVGMNVQPMPDGFNIIPSTPPTYVANSRFAKLSGNTAFYNISGSTPITPQGAYTTPAVGNLVFFQRGTFPLEVGVITNSTLTSGTFAINDFNVFDAQQITNITGISASGLVSNGAAVSLGNVIVAKTTTDDRYKFHIVSTAANINAGALRLDDGAQPSFSGTTFAALGTSDCDTTNGSNPPQILGGTGGACTGAGLDLQVGNLLFAKVTANADNLNTYAWHLVTTAQNFATDTAPTTLRLDNNASAPTFAANSTLANLNPESQGAISGDATTFSLGDVAFLPKQQGVHGFGMIKSSGTGIASRPLENSAGQLTVSTSYVATATTGVKDAAGNPLASNVVVTFTTGATGGTNTTPPFVQNSQPNGGSQNHPIGAPIRMTFSVDMATGDAVGSITNATNIALSTDNFGAPGTAVTTTKTYDSATKTVTLTPTSSLLAATGYVVEVKTTAKSSAGTAFPQPFKLFFRTASGAADAAAPTVLGRNPAPGSTNASLGAVITIGFSEDIDPSTISTNTITLKKTSNSAAVTGNVTYNPTSRSANFSPTVALEANTGYTITIIAGPGGVKDISGNQIGSATPANDITSTFTTTASADTTNPFITFANADNFSLAVTFNESMKLGNGPNAADNIANYTLESPVGTAINLGGKTIAYESGIKTAKITGLSLQNGNTFKVTVAPLVQDLSSRSMETTGAPAKNTSFGAVQNSTATGGQIGPGTGTIDRGMQGMNPTRVSPMTRAAGSASNYKVEFLAGTSIPLGGQIILTFPEGFTLANAAAIATANSFCNADMNGPMTGSVTIASVEGDTSAGTVTITTAGAATGANAFLCMDLSGITNSTVPSSTGYTVTMQTKDTAGNNRSTLQNLTASPFFLGSTGSRTLTVNVFKDANGNSTNNGGEGINGVKVFLFSPATGGQEAITATNVVDGVATFSNLSDGQYMIGIKPSDEINVAFNSAPQPISITGNATKNFILSNTVSLTISGTVTGTNGTKVDVFAASPNGFSKKTLTLTGGADAYSLPVSANTSYNVGVGPAIPETFNTPGAPPPPPPTFTFMPPPNVEVQVANISVTGTNFTLTTTSKTITGTVVDSNGAGVANTGVFCRPIASSTTGDAEGFGTGAQTNNTGAFTINVTPGKYLCGIFKPGMPNVADKQITVPSTGANSPTSLTFSLKVDTAAAITITGTISDDSGNAIPYSGVNARKVVSSSDTTPVGGGGQNFVGGPSDVNGAYTLYVTANSTWVVEAFAPGFGKLGTKTVSITTTSLSGQDFSAQTLSIGTITGTVTAGGSAVQGAMVRAEGSSGGNMAISDAAGLYTIKVPAGSYTVRGFVPGKGEFTPLTNVTVTANTTTANQDLTMGAAVTITVNVTDGTNPITNAGVDVRDSNGRGNFTHESTTSGVNAVYTVSVPPGTYTVRVGHPAYGKIGETTGVDSTRAITYTASAGQLYAVTGTVSAGGEGLASAWVMLTGSPTGQTSIINVGGQTGADGTFSIQAPPGRYAVRADKPGYKSPAAVTANVSGATAVGTITLTTASRTITGTVTLDSVAVSNAFVDATDGNGGFAVAQTDASGAYSLAIDNGTWTLRARSIGYEGTLTVTVANNSPSTQTITLSAISGFTIKPEKQESITPTSGGFLTNSDIGANFKVNFPANALGTGSNAATVATQPNTAVPNPSNGSVLNKNAISISAVDSGGSPVKNLNDNITIVVPYSEADIPAGGTEGSLTLGVWNDATQAYDTLSTTVDTTNNTLTATVSHLSVFAPLLFTSVAATSSADSTPPAAPVSIKATSDGKSVTLSWTDPVDSDLSRILVLRNSGGTTPISGDPYAYVDKGKKTYTDTNVTAGTTYKYIVRAQDTSGNGSTNLNEVSVKVEAGATAATPPSTPTAPVVTTTPVFTPTTTPTTPTTTPVAPVATTTAPSISTKPSAAPTAVEVAKAKVSATKASVNDAKSLLADAKTAVKNAQAALKAATKAKNKEAIAAAKSAVKDAQKTSVVAQKAVTKAQVAYNSANAALKKAEAAAKAAAAKAAAAAKKAAAAAKAAKAKAEAAAKKAAAKKK